jgi:hypothetical protein
METQTERLVQGNEGISTTGAESEISPEQSELAAIAVADAIGTEAVSEAETESGRPEIPGEISNDTPKPPPGYEGVPPELWPDANGNPPQLTEKLMRTLRGKYFTVRHVLLTDCGHKLDMINEPKNNCQTCWWTWFNSHPQLVEITDQFFRTHGKGPLVSMRGVKFFKMFVRFMSTVHHFLEQEKLKNDTQSGNANPGTLGDGTVVEEAGQARQGISSEANDQSGEAVSRGISSGLVEQAI